MVRKINEILLDLDKEDPNRVFDNMRQLKSIITKMAFKVMELEDDSKKDIACEYCEIPLDKNNDMIFEREDDDKGIVIVCEKCIKEYVYDGASYRCMNIKEDD